VRELPLWPRGALWRHGDFLRLWAAQTVSQFGSQISGIAIPLVAILTLDSSAFEVALLSSVEMLPFLLIALPAGVWVDRLPRKPILVAADLGRALALASIPLAWAFDVLTIWQLYAVGFVVGVFTVFFDVAYQSYLPSLVSRAQLVDGNSKLEVSRSTAQIGGPGLGGVLVEVITAPYAIVADAVSFLWSGLLVLRIGTHEERPAPTESPNMKRELIEGVRYIVRDPRWRAISLYVSTVNFCWSVAFSIVLVYAVRDLGLSAGTIGLIFALGNVGALIGAVLSGRVATRLGIGRTIVFSAVLSGFASLLVPLAPRDNPLPFLVAALVGSGAGIVLYNVTAISLMQALTPPRLLGRMNASRRWIVWGTIPLGGLAGGALAETIGLRETLFAGTIAASLCFLFLLARPLRTIEQLPDPEERPQGEPEDALVELPHEAQRAEL
jgi:MFS family permease